MDPLKVRLNFELGFFNFTQLKKQFMHASISYSDPGVGSVFSNHTYQFLKSLSDSQLLDLYLGIENAIPARELARFQLTLNYGWEFRIKLSNYTHELFGRTPVEPEFPPLEEDKINLLIKILLDGTLRESVNLSYVLAHYKKNENLRIEIKKHPELVKRITQANRNATYIWGDLLAEAGSEDYLLWPMAPIMAPLPE